MKHLVHKQYSTVWKTSIVKPLLVFLRFLPRHSKINSYNNLNFSIAFHTPDADIKVIFELRLKTKHFINGQARLTDASLALTFRSQFQESSSQANAVFWKLFTANFHVISINFGRYVMVEKSSSSLLRVVKIVFKAKGTRSPEPITSGSNSMYAEFQPFLPSQRRSDYNYCWNHK